MKKILYTILGIIGLALSVPLSVYAITGFSSWQLTGVTTDVVGNCFKVASGFAITSGSCGAGGGSSGGTFSTSTSNVPGQFTNFPNNTTDIVVVGSSATTTAPIFLDPNTKLVRVNGSIGTTSLPVNFINTSNLTIGSLSGILKGTSGVVGTAANGTDYTLLTSTSCATGSTINAVTASGGVTCGNAFSTTSTDYWLTVNRGNAFSTTSADYWGGTKGYITGNQSITLSGDVTGSGATAITTTLKNTGPGAGSYTNANITLDAQGRVTAASNGTAGSASSTLYADNGSFTGNNTFVNGLTSLGTVQVGSVGNTGMYIDGVNNLGFKYSTNEFMRYGGGDLHVGDAISGNTFFNGGDNIDSTGALILNGKLTGTYASTTAISGNALCISTDCRTSWPSAGSGSYPFQGINNSTSTLTQFNGGLTAYASSTVGNGLSNGGLTVNGTATTSTLCLGTDCRSAWPSAGGGAYPFALTGNATSTLTQFNAGLTAYASSTIGDGTGLGGLTINGSATSTGPIYIAGGNLAYPSINTGMVHFIAGSGLTAGKSIMTQASNGTDYTLLTTNNCASGLAIVGVNANGSSSCGNAFSTTSADAYINASSTIAHPAGGAFGNLIEWDGSKWTSAATSSLKINFSDLAGLASLTSQVTGVLPIANGGTNASSFTTSGNAAYYTGSALATAPLTSAVTTPYASSTYSSAVTASSTNLYTAPGYRVYSTFDKSLIVGSSTPDANYKIFGTATSSFNVWNPSQAVGATKLYCKTTNGGVTAEMGNGTATTTAICTSSGVSSASTVTWTSGTNVTVNIGNISSAANSVTVTPTFYNQ